MRCEVTLGGAPLTLALTGLSLLFLAIQTSGLVSAEELQIYFAAVPIRYMRMWDGSLVRRCLLWPFLHKDATHLVANYSGILLAGPVLERKFGSFRILGLVLVTAVFTAAINSVMFETGIIGSSGIVMAMLLLLGGAELHIITPPTRPAHSGLARASSWDSPWADAEGDMGEPPAASAFRTSASLSSTSPAESGGAAWRRGPVLRIPLPMLLLLGIYVGREVYGIAATGSDGISRFAHLAGVAAGLVAAVAMGGRSPAAPGVKDGR